MSKVTKAVILSVVGVLVVFGVGFLLFVYSGAYNVAASKPHTALGNWMLGTVMETSVRERAADVGPVPDLSDSARVQSGFTHYREMCVICHGAPGVDRGELSQGMVPEPPLLHEEVGEWSDRELFWIVKHGIKMSGMPAWGPTHDDEQLWGIVAFLRRLPQLSPEEYQELSTAAAAAEAGGHEHDGGHGHDGGHRQDGGHGQGAEEGHTHGPGEGHSHDEGAGAPAVTVRMTNDLTFDPRTVRIRKGETVRWRNTSDVVHTVTANREMASDPSNVRLPQGAQPFNSGNLQPGGEFRHTFDVAGEYRYFCIPHEAAGMVGTVIVE